MRQEDLTELHYGATSIRVLGSKLLLYDEPDGALYLADVEQTGKWARLTSDSGDALWVASWLSADLLREKSGDWGELVAVRDGDAMEVYEMDGVYLNLLGRYQASELLLSDTAAAGEASLGTSAVVMLHKAGADDHVHHVHVIAHAAGNAGKDNALDREVIQQGRGIAKSFPSVHPEQKEPFLFPS